jgi:hypothetical protein
MSRREVMDTMRKAILIILFIFLGGCNFILGKDDSGTRPGEPGMVEPYDLYIEGQPDGALMRIEGGYYIWKTGNTFHVRTTGPERLRITPPVPVFSGIIHVDTGFVINVVRQNLAPFDEVRLSAHDLGFHIELKNDIAGFDFDIRPAFGSHYCLTLEPRYNAALDPRMVHLGRTMFIPRSLPLTACFH